MNILVKHKKVHGQGKEIVWNVFNYFRGLDIYKNTPIDLSYTITAKATGYSKRTVQRIVRDGKKMEVSETHLNFITPDQKRNNVKKVKSLIDDFDRCALRRTIMSMYVEDKIAPTVQRVFEKNKNCMNLGSISTLTRVLEEIGFEFVKTKTNTNYLIEKHQIRLKRIEYLKNILEFRKQGRTIVYTNESYISPQISKKSGNNSDKIDKVVHEPVSKGKRLVIFHAGGEAGFIPNVLLTWEAQCSSDNYNDNTYKENYRKWVEEKLLLNLSPRSVIVMSDASYHNYQPKRCPTSKSLKQDMIDWLADNNISFSSNMFKPELYHIIRKHKVDLVKCSLDSIFKEKGHIILRLPLYHPDLNPMEIIWARTKGWVANQNHNSNMKQINELCKIKLDSVEKSEWEAVWENVKKLEIEIWKKESSIDFKIDNLIITNGDDSSSEDSYVNSENEVSDED